MTTIRRRSIAACVALAVLAAVSGPARAAHVEATEVNGTWTLTNGPLTVRLNAKDATFSAEAGPRRFVAKAALGKPGDAAAAVRRTNVADALGAGKAVEVTHQSGRVTALRLYEGLPFVCLKVTVPNAGKEPLGLSTVAALAAEVDAGAELEALRMLGPEGSYPPGADRDHYAVAAVADPKTRTGIVCGWLTHHRASGVVSIRSKDGPLRIEARGEYGKVTVPPGTALEGELLAIGWFDDGLAGLETYARSVAKAHQVKLPPRVPSGYCTWYHAGALDEKRLAELATWCKAHLARFGFDFLQIDDGWQIAGRDFTAHNPGGAYRSGMSPTADAVTGAGLTAGLWLIPFGWDPKRPVFKDHQDWFVHRQDGSLYEVKWAGTCLDMTHPGARGLVRDVVSRITRQWHYKYIKIDGLWTGLAAKIRYPDPAYGPDGLGDAVFADPSKTNVEAYRSGLALVREAAGDDVFILGCNIAQNMRTMGGSVGLVDGMRIGPDVGAHWGGILSCARPATNLYYWHGAAWFNDPDCLMLRPPLTLDQARAWASMIVLSGQMVVVSEWLPGLAPERLDVLKRTIPNHGGLGRPLDLFADGLAAVWHLRADLGGERRDLVGLFNWNETRDAQAGVGLAALGLPDGPDETYVGFDYWENAFVPPLAKTLAALLRPSSCRVISLVRAADHPQLVGTSRHVTQGAVDVARVAWDPGARTLRGRSRLVGGDPYELRIVAPPAPVSWQAVSATASANGVAAVLEQHGPAVRVRLESADGGETDWQVVFTQGPPATAGPRKVTGLSARATPSRGVEVTWQGDADRYRIAREPGNVIVAGAARLSDGNVEPGKTYHYTVTAVGWTGEESDPATVEVKTPALPPPPPPPDVHLSALEPLKATVGWGNGAQTDKSIEGNPIRVGGKAYAKGMGVHAPSELVYGLEPGYERFVAVVGVDDEKKDDGRASVVFRVIVDGRVLRETGVLRAGAPPEGIDVAIPNGSKQIRLVATDAGDGNKADHADWANAGFLRHK